MSPVPVSTCPVLTRTQTAARHQQHAPLDSVPIPTSDLANMNTSLASCAPLSLWKDRGKHSQHLNFHTPWKQQQVGAQRDFFWLEQSQSSSLQPAFISTTRINAAHKDAVINASRFLLSHHVLQQLVNTKGANRNCSKDCKRVKEISSSVCSLSSDGGIIN